MRGLSCAGCRCPADADFTITLGVRLIAFGGHLDRDVTLT
jgi:hypothetical protein